MSKHAYYSLSRTRFSDSEDCYILLVLFIFYHFSENRFFHVPEPIFAKLFHTMQYVLKLIISYGVFMCR